MQFPSRSIVFHPAFVCTVVVVASAATSASLAGETAVSERPQLDDAAAVVAEVDRRVVEHWAEHDVEPAAEAGDATLLRRMTLDLAGRIPTADEWIAYRDDSSADKRLRLVERLLEGPEFPLHFANVLDKIVQDRYAGDEAFLRYLRRALAQRRGWDEMFRNVLVGPWETDQQKQSNRFLVQRVKDHDRMSTDATRAFFGVDISCAKCHDHPLVIDWSQDHYYGMLSFFSRTTGGKGGVGEKKEAEVKFLAGGEEKTARMMFLTGRTFDDDAGDAAENDAKEADAAGADGKSDKQIQDKRDKDGGKGKSKIGARQQLVEAALAEKSFFSRAIVNRLWHYFFGRGLVQPVDQMHSENEPAIDGVLSLLAEDLAAHDYDLRRTIRILVSTRVYSLDSRWTGDEDLPAPEMFAVARLRPLSRRQLALSLMLATGDDEGFPSQASSDERAAAWLAFEERADSLIAAIDPRVDGFESSAAEALYLSNDEAVQQLISGGDNSLAQRLAAVNNDRKLVKTAYRRLLSREPTRQEVRQLADWLKSREIDRAEACGDLVWALLTSAEFRFLP